MSCSGGLDDLGLRVRDLLRSLGTPAVAPFLADWPDPSGARPVRIGPAAGSAPLPVLNWLPEIARDEGNFGPSVVEILCRHADSLAWRQTYSAADVGTDFLRKYAYAELVGPRAPLPATRISGGFLLLGPSTLYPRHRHEAEEIYVPLSGTARWQQGAGGWRERHPGTVIHHASQEPHAMLTGERPLLALYVWRGEHLNRKARLESGGGPLLAVY